MGRTAPIDEAALRRLWAADVSAPAIAEALGCHANTVLRRAEKFALPERYPGWKPSEVITHTSAVTMPATRLEDRPDWPDLLAAVRRSGGSAVALGQAGARFRVPYGVLRGLWGRVGAT